MIRKLAVVLMCVLAVLCGVGAAVLVGDSSQAQASAASMVAAETSSTATETSTTDASTTTTDTTSTTTETAPSETTTTAIVDVRVEGDSETLFEGPVETEGGYIKAISDTEWRDCDGTNNGANGTPGPTATKAAVDAMQIIGQTFDAEATWWDEYGDYYITSFAGEDGLWSISVNGAITNVGGCQFEVQPGDQVLWQNNGFADYPVLELWPGGDSVTSAPPLTVDVTEGEPLTVQVESSSGTSYTQQIYKPVAGVDVSPVSTASNGYETVETDDAYATTGSDGTAEITFGSPGWHRIMASGADDAPEDADYRSNRLDVCVIPTGETQEEACGTVPSDDEVRCASASSSLDDDSSFVDCSGATYTSASPTRCDQTTTACTTTVESATGTTTTATTTTTTTETTPGITPSPSSGSSTTTARTATASGRTVKVGKGQRQTVISVLRLGSVSGLRVRASWKIKQRGSGLRKWEFFARRSGYKRDRWVVVAHGGSGTHATLRVPRSGRWQVRVTFTTRRGARATARLGSVRVR